MFILRKSEDRGHFEHGWLNTYHSFSFGDYYDPHHMGFRSLRVINEDTIEPKGGFPTHSHKEMEIITYLVEGALEHKDSVGNSAVIHPGDVQRMSAGTGIRHSEFNHYSDRKTHLLQIWILPNEHALSPSYDQQSFSEKLVKENFLLVAAPDAREGSVLVHQDLYLYAAKWNRLGEIKEISLAEGRHAWIQLIRGSLAVNEMKLQAGDGLAISEELHMQLKGLTNDVEFLLFDLP